MKKLMMIILLLSLMFAQEASACFSDLGLTRVYGTGHSRYGDWDWAWALGFIGNRHELRYNNWFDHGQSDHYPVERFRGVINGKYLVTEEHAREFTFDFSSLDGLSFVKADLRFSVKGPKRGSEEVSLLADGVEIFSSELSRRQMNYRIDLLKLASDSLGDRDLTLKFLAPEGDYFVRHIALDIRVKDPDVTPVPIPASFWLFGSALGTLLIGRFKKQ